jgi:hypothetical protein
MEKEEYIITPQGSLGILALGHIGLRKWREVVKIEKAKKESSKNINSNVKKK